MKTPILFTLKTPEQQRQTARLLIRALLEAGDASAEASSTGNPGELIKAERAIDRAITRAYRYMTGEAPPSDQDLVDFIYGEPE
jgi:hypothetical protein